jgi:LCP family protein required for cell wall assembly
MIYEWYIRNSMLSRRSVVIVGVMVAMVFAAIVASVYVYSRAYDYFANDLPILVEIMPQQRPQVIATPAPSENIVLPDPWDGKERVNILLMGIDQRIGDKEPAHRTDTMIVFTLDPITLEAGILSIPRDIWVPVPGFDDPNYRINQANFLGDAYDYPGGGIALARKVVENFLGVPIHHVARINFTAFENFVDRIGGVTIDVPNDIYDPDYPTEDYRTEVFTLTQGLQNLDGETALKYARTRHSQGGDFDRARRQQQVILAVREKLNSPQVLASLIAASPELLRELSTSIKTDITLDQMQQLAVLAQKIDRDKIESEVLDQRYTEFATTPSGDQVVIPNRARIAELREKFFATTADGAAERRMGQANPTPASP